MKIHSYSDLITNSSTVTYIYPSENAVEHVKELINKIVRLSGGSKTADEMFDFEVKMQNHFAWDKLEDAVDDDTHPHQQDAIDLMSKMDSMAYDEVDKCQETTEPPQWLSDYASSWSDPWSEDRASLHKYIKVTDKDGKATRVYETMRKIFDATGWRDG